MVDKKLSNLKEQINTNNNRLHTYTTDTLPATKSAIIKKVEELIVEQRQFIVEDVENAFKKSGNDILFEFIIDEELAKSSYMSLNTILNKEKDKYTAFLNRLILKENQEIIDLNSKNSEYKRLVKELAEYKDGRDDKLKQIRQFIQTSDNRTKDGRKLAKDFEIRISNLESLSFAKVIEESESGSGGFSDIDFDEHSAELNDYKSMKSSKSIHPNIDNGYRRY